MKKETVRKIRYVILVLGGLLIWLLFVMSGFGEAAYGAEEGSGNAIFSVDHESGFYAEDIAVLVVCPDRVKVYYTMDCSEPAQGKTGTLLYEEPIYLKAPEEESVQTIRMKAVYQDRDGSEAETDTRTYTYILGKNVKNRYNTLVASITGEPEDFFGYEKGIFVEGKVRDEFLKENPGRTDKYADANYFMEGIEAEREANIHIFSADGELKLEQDCGIRITGGSMRGQNQKSMQLFARRAYDKSGNFHAVLFSGAALKEDGTILDKENRLRFRNSGNDFDRGFIRDALVQNLAAQADFEMAAEALPVAVYLNDSYYGCMWLQEPFSSGAIENRYGDFNGEFVTLELDEENLEVKSLSEEGQDDALYQYAKEFQQFYDDFQNLSMQDDADYKTFCDTIDIDNFMRYFAIQIYIGNVDWPWNNVKAYRFVSENGEYAQEGLLDGRYRYLLFDTDLSLAAHFENNYNAYGAEEDNLAYMLYRDKVPVLGELLHRQECQDMLINDFCDLMNGVFRKENVLKEIDLLDSAREKELSYFIEHSDLTGEAVTSASVKEEIKNIKEFFRKRPKAVYQIIETDFPVCRRFLLKLQKPENAKVSVNHIREIGEDFEGYYYAECALQLEAEVEEGYVFDHWLINGKEYDSEKLELAEQDLRELLQIPQDAEYGEEIDYLEELQVELAVVEDKEAAVCIAALCEKGSDDIICLYNPSPHKVTTAGLYLTDDAEKMKKYAVPETELEAKEILILYGRRCQYTGEHRLSFNIKEGEALILSDADGVIEKLTVPDMTFEDTWYVKDLYTGEYQEMFPEELPVYLKGLKSCRDKDEK